MDKTASTKPLKKLGRFVQIKKVFTGATSEVQNPFSAMYEAETWLRSKGYSSGSLDGHNPVAITRGSYDLPEKWHNMSIRQRQNVAGVFEFERGENCTVYIFNTFNF